MPVHTSSRAPRRFRGHAKHALWRRPEQVGVIVLPLVVEGAWERRRLECLFEAMYSIKRALQRDVRERLRIYWASPRRLREGAATWREELGLTRVGLEHLAYQHLERSGWLLHHVGKALVMHMADEVWTAAERHLFGDSDGHRSGMPRVGGYWDFTRIPGRARSHTVDRKWETFRLFGTLDGHLAAYRHPELPAQVTTSEGASRLGSGASVLHQPWHLRPPERPGSWWEHAGPLVLVFNGAPRSRAGELVLPVRLPQGSGRWPYLVHYLGEPERWHKVDLVRRRDASAPGGWVYEAHLMVLGPGYCSPRTQARREAAAGSERVGGVDGNVSNLAVVSFPRSLSPEDGEVTSTRIVLSEHEKARLDRERRRNRGRQRALDRSRRASNARQYRLSSRQRRRAKRRAGKGLRERQVAVPGGERLAGAGGHPQQPYREDVLSQGYRQRRAEHAEAAAGLQEARDRRAEEVAAAIVALHGPRLTIEKGRIGPWFRRWGRACLAFTPGRLIAALAVFAEPIHPGDPDSARVDYEQSRRVLGAFNQRLEAAVAGSTVIMPSGATAARRSSPWARRGRASARRDAGHCVVPTPVGSTVSSPESHARNPDFHNRQDLWKGA